MKGGVRLNVLISWAVDLHYYGRWVARYGAGNTGLAGGFDFPHLG